MSTINEVKQKFEELFKVKLIERFCSREEDAPDEEFGHFKSFTFEPTQVEEADPEPELLIWESGLAQFFHDAQPYPCEAHTEEEKMDAMRFLTPCPLPFEKWCAQDFKNFISEVQEVYS